MIEFSQQWRTPENFETPDYGETGRGCEMGYTEEGESQSTLVSFILVFLGLLLKSADGYMVDLVCKSVWTYIVKIQE